MPPEQALSRPKDIDPQTDLWSVGATMFTLLSGELVHIAQNSSEHLVKAATRHARSVASVVPGIPTNVERLIGRALRFEKQERWESAAHMRTELWRVRLDPGRPIGTPSAPPPAHPASNFPTVVGRREPSHGLRELAMSLGGSVPVEEVRTRRAVFLSAAVAVLLIVGALASTVLLTAQQVPARIRVAGAHEYERAPMALQPAAMLQTLPTGVTPTVAATPAPSAAPSASVAPVVTSTRVGAGHSTKGASKPAAAPSVDLYKPF
jgi:serine/threonine-protein kinase